MAGEIGFQRQFPFARFQGMGAVLLAISMCGCNLFGSGQQLKQLRAENDRLISEFRAQRDRLATLQQTNAMLEARVGEAEKLLARSGQTLPSSRISQAPARTPSELNSTSTATGTASSLPPYIPPNVPSLPGTDRGASNTDGVKWRPMKKQ